MLDPTDRLIIDDIRRVAAARLAAPAGAALVGAPGKTSPAQLTFEGYKTAGGNFRYVEMNQRGGYKWLRAAAVLAASGVDLDARGDDPACDPRWAALLASRFRVGGCGTGAAIAGRASVSTAVSTAPGSETASHAEIVRDIARVAAAAGLVLPLRPTFQQYRALGGLYSNMDVTRRGGWDALCSAAGFSSRRALHGDPAALRRVIIEDIARVAASLAAADPAAATSNGLSKSEYRQAGGRFSHVEVNSVQDQGGWPGLCQAAGVKPPAPRFVWSRQAKRARQAAAAAAAATPCADAADVMNQGQRDAALNRAVAPIQPPKPIAWVMGNGNSHWKRPRRRPAAAAQRFSLDRDEVLADVRIAARAAGVPVARLDLETYHAFGGRYQLPDFREFSGFTALCRAAAAAASHAA